MGNHPGSVCTRNAAPDCGGSEQLGGSLTASRALSAARAVGEALAPGMDLPASPLLQTLPAAMCKYMEPLVELYRNRYKSTCYGAIPASNPNGQHKNVFPVQSTAAGLENTWSVDRASTNTSVYSSCPTWVRTGYSGPCFTCETHSSSLDINNALRV